MSQTRSQQKVKGLKTLTLKQMLQRLLLYMEQRNKLIQ